MFDQAHHDATSEVLIALHYVYIVRGDASLLVEVFDSWFEA